MTGMLVKFVFLRAVFIMFQMEDCSWPVSDGSCTSVLWQFGGLFLLSTFFASLSVCSSSVMP